MSGLNRLVEDNKRLQLHNRIKDLQAQRDELLGALHATAEKLSLVMTATNYGEATINQALSDYRAAIAKAKENT